MNMFWLGLIGTVSYFTITISCTLPLCWANFVPKCYSATIFYRKLSQWLSLAIYRITQIIVVCCRPLMKIYLQYTCFTAKLQNIWDKNMITEWSLMTTKLIMISQWILKKSIYLRYMMYCAVCYSQNKALFSPYNILFIQKTYSKHRGYLGNPEWRTFDRSFRFITSYVIVFS